MVEGASPILADTGYGITNLMLVGNGMAAKMHGYYLRDVLDLVFEEHIGTVLLSYLSSHKMNIFLFICPGPDGQFHHMPKNNESKDT